MEAKYLKLDRGKDFPIRNRHHWIFSGAVASGKSETPGEIVPVYSSSEELLGHAYVNSKSNIVGRMVSFGKDEPYSVIRENILSAINYRKQLFNEQTNTYRIINGEGDSLPGLVVDRYDNVLVVQVSTLGMELLKTYVIDILQSELNPVCIYEKSAMPSRRNEGLTDQVGVLAGELLSEVVVLENGVKFGVDIVKGQKTGLFLDQREMRSLIGSLSKGKSLLNCFAYTGGFSLYAAKNGATKVTSIDIAKDAVKAIEHNYNLNNLDKSKAEFIADDVFKYLRNNKLDFDIIILDPPAFAKKREDVPSATSGYREINRQVFKKAPKGSLLLTCSCSYHVDSELFQKIIMQAAQLSGRRVRIVGKHRLAADHVFNIYHPDADYLKSLLIYID